MYTTLIKDVRKALGITQQELARRVDLSQAEVSRKENGLALVSIDQLFLFASALGVSITRLLPDWDGPQDGPVTVEAVMAWLRKCSTELSAAAEAI